MIRRLARALRPLALTALLLGAPLGAGAASAEPALWKVKSGGATIYLFGTVHVLKPDTHWRSAKIDAALKSADVLWLEVTNADDPAAMQPLIQKYGLDPAHPLSTKLDAASKAKLTRFIAGLGMAEGQFEPMRPWLVGLSVDVLPLMKAGYDPKSGVEEILKGEEETAGKPIKGFETAEEQIRYLADVSPQVELDFLKSSLDDAGKAVDDIDEMVAAWAAGDEKALEVLMNKDMQDDYPDIYDRLLVQRNRRFAAKIALLARQTGVVFVAVGAAHLLGPDSIQADLKKLGLIAERQ